MEGHTGMPSTIVRLSPHEWAAASTLGHKRQWLRENRGKSPAEYRDGGGTHLERNAIGAVAEYALAKHYGKDTLQDWCENKSFSLEHHKIACDVGLNLHVRASNNTRARLVAHPYDPDGGVFVLALTDASLRLVSFVGWCWGREAKQPIHWDDYSNGFRYRPAFAVPSHYLQPMSTVPHEAIR